MALCAFSFSVKYVSDSTIYYTLFTVCLQLHPQQFVVKLEQEHDCPEHVHSAFTQLAKLKELEKLVHT